jgi:hypothetical protein
MGRITKGILGGFSGIVGTVIGGTWKGIDYMRSKPNKKKGVATADQLMQQAKFTMMMRFLQTMTGLLEITFKSAANKMTEFNAAFSYNLKNAVTGLWPNFKVDYAKALVSRGNLPNAGAPAAVAAGSGIITFSWTDNSGTGNAVATDKTVLAAYCPAMDSTIYTSGTTTRADGGEKLDVTLFTGQAVETWIAFVSAEGTDAANSLFLGELTVS